MAKKFKWRVRIVFLEKLPGDKWGEPVANSEVFEIETDYDSTDMARDEADRRYNANPRVQHTPKWRIDGDYIPYANITRVDD